MLMMILTLFTVGIAIAAAVVDDVVAAAATLTNLYMPSPFVSCFTIPLFTARLWYIYRL